MKTIKLLLIGFLLSINGSILSGQTGSLCGVVSDLESGETLPFVNVIVKDLDGKVINGASTDLDGFYKIEELAPGKYQVEASFTGYASEKFSELQIQNARLSSLNVFLMEESTLLQEVEVVYLAPLIGRTKCGRVTTSCCWTHCGGCRDIYEQVLGDSLLLPVETFSLYPNPSYGEINLKSETKMERVVITNMNGQQVAELKVEDPQELRAHLNLPDGIYLVHLSDGASKQTQKWVVQ